MKCFVFCTLVGLAHAELILYDADGTSFMVGTSTFKYFGRQDRVNITGAQAVFINGAALCNPHRELVTGKVVLTDLAGTGCHPGIYFSKIAEAGALALVM